MQTSQRKVFKIFRTSLDLIVNSDKECIQLSYDTRMTPLQVAVRLFGAGWVIGVGHFMEAEVFDVPTEA